MGAELTKSLRRTGAIALTVGLGLTACKKEDPSAAGSGASAGSTNASPAGVTLTTNPPPTLNTNSAATNAPIVVDLKDPTTFRYFAGLRLRGLNSNEAFVQIEAERTQGVTNTVDSLAQTPPPAPTNAAPQIPAAPPQPSTPKTGTASAYPAATVDVQQFVNLAKEVAAAIKDQNPDLANQALADLTHSIKLLTPAQRDELMNAASTAHSPVIQALHDKSATRKVSADLCNARIAVLDAAYPVAFALVNDVAVRFATEERLAANRAQLQVDNLLQYRREAEAKIQLPVGTPLTSSDPVAEVAALQAKTFSAVWKAISKDAYIDGRYVDLPSPGDWNKHIESLRERNLRQRRSGANFR